MDLPDVRGWSMRTTDLPSTSVVLIYRGRWAQAHVALNGEPMQVCPSRSMSSVSRCVKHVEHLYSLSLIITEYPLTPYALEALESLDKRVKLQR